MDDTLFDFFNNKSEFFAKRDLVSKATHRSPFSSAVATLAPGGAASVGIQVCCKRILCLSAKDVEFAHECRVRAETFRNEQPRVQMLQLAADYDRKAKQAEAIEASLRKMRDKVA